MLILGRKVGERIRIGDDVIVEVMRVDRNRVALGFKAPEGVEIFRMELYEKRFRSKP